MLVTQEQCQEQGRENHFLVVRRLSHHLHHLLLVVLVLLLYCRSVFTEHLLLIPASPSCETDLVLVSSLPSLMRCTGTGMDQQDRLHLLLDLHLLSTSSVHEHKQCVYALLHTNSQQHSLSP